LSATASSRRRPFRVSSSSRFLDRNVFDRMRKSAKPAADPIRQPTTAASAARNHDPDQINGNRPPAAAPGPFWLESVGPPQFAKAMRWHPALREEAVFRDPPDL